MPLDARGSAQSIRQRWPPRRRSRPDPSNPPGGWRDRPVRPPTGRSRPRSGPVRRTAHRAERPAGSRGVALGTRSNVISIAAAQDAAVLVTCRPSTCSRCTARSGEGEEGHSAGSTIPLTRTSPKRRRKPARGPWSTPTATPRSRASARPRTPSDATPRTRRARGRGGAQEAAGRGRGAQEGRGRGQAQGRRAGPEALDQAARPRRMTPMARQVEEIGAGAQTRIRCHAARPTRRAPRRSRRASAADAPSRGRRCAARRCVRHRAAQAPAAAAGRAPRGAQAPLRQDRRRPCGRGRERFPQPLGGAAAPPPRARAPPRA